MCQRPPSPIPDLYTHQLSYPHRIRPDPHSPSVHYGLASSLGDQTGHTSAYLLVLITSRPQRRRIPSLAPLSSGARVGYPILRDVSGESWVCRVDSPRRAPLWFFIYSSRGVHPAAAVPHPWVRLKLLCMPCILCVRILHLCVHFSVGTADCRGWRVGNRLCYEPQDSLKAEQEKRKSDRLRLPRSPHSPRRSSNVQAVPLSISPESPDERSSSLLRQPIQ